ncbi:MAG: hypothetical protein AAF597_17900, partial [Bacteroidota bacterium]
MNLKITFRKEHLGRRAEVVILKVRPAEQNKIVFSPGATTGMISKIFPVCKTGLEQALSEVKRLSKDTAYEVVFIRLRISQERSRPDFWQALFSQIFDQENGDENTEISRLRPYPEGRKPKFAINDRVTTILGREVSTERIGLIWDCDFHQVRSEFV